MRPTNRNGWGSQLTDPSPEDPATCILHHHIFQSQSKKKKAKPPERQNLVLQPVNNKSSYIKKYQNHLIVRSAIAGQER